MGDMAITAKSSRNGLVLLAIGALTLAGIVGFRAWESREGEAPEPTGQEEASGGIEALVARTQSNPDDPEAWAELGFARFERGEFGEAVTAYERATGLSPDEAVLWASLGEARVMASERDPMPADAVEAFEKALSLDPNDPRSRYFMAVRRDLSGDHEGAIDDWLALLGDTPPGAPWEGDLARTIEQVGQINSIDTEERMEAAQAERRERFATGSGMPGVPALTGGAAIPGPSAEQLAAARTMSADEQQQMAEGMVARLEQRLESDPSNIDGWVMLMRSRMTLGQPDRARAALQRAKAANPSQAGRLDAEAEALGVS